MHSNCETDASKIIHTTTTMKRRRMNRLSHQSPIRMMTLTQVILLLLVAVWADDSKPPFFATSQSSPQQAPQPAPQLITPRTGLPTSVPVIQPTTNRPVIAPTRRPVTENPTVPPVSSSPTPKPTPAPTSPPTAEESATPSMKLTPEPSMTPSTAPSISPKPVSVTLRPTVSAKPTVTPTSSPISRAPVRQPIRNRTTIQPTNVPSPAPSISQQITTVSIEIILSPTTRKLSDQAYSDFEVVTETFLMDQIKATVGSDFVTIVGVQIEIVSQKIDNLNNRKLSTRRRLQQSENDDLRIRCNAKIVYKQEPDGETVNDENVPEWIKESFQSKESRLLYLADLQVANNDIFGPISTVNVLVAGTDNDNDDEPIDQKSSNGGFFENENLWYIIGAVGGTLSLIVIISMLFLIHRNKKLKMGGVVNGKQNMTAITNIKNQLSYDSDTSPTNKLHYTTEIDVDLHNDDVSTLGDPTYYGGAPDQPTVASGQLSDAANYFTTTNTTAHTNSNIIHAQRDRFLSDETDQDNILMFSESNLSKQNDDIITHTLIDDNGLASTQQNNNGKIQRVDGGSGGGYGSKFAVEVPPGKLGMIIDTPDNGPPIVHTIKPESILIATVQAGDYLLCVDDENVSHMTAVQVSKLISIKSDQQRTLLFLRKHVNRNRINSSSSDYIVEQNGTC